MIKSSHSNWLSPMCFRHMPTFIVCHVVIVCWDTLKQIQYSSVQLLSRVQLFVTPWTAAQQVSLSITYSWNLNSYPLSQWCHPTVSSSVIPFSSCLQACPASGSFPMSWFFTWDGQSIGVSATVIPMNTQDWFPLGLPGFISLLSIGLSRVFSNTIVQKHQFFSTQPSL